MKRLNHETIRVLVCLLVLLPGLAAANAGKVLFVRGEVSIVGGDGQQRPGEAGAVLYEADHVLTGERGMAQLRLSDGALVSLRPHSDYQIEVQEEEEGLMEQAATLFQGWMRKVSGAIGRDGPESVSDKTPVATIGIRGTVYQIIHLPEGGLPGYENTAPGTYVYLEEGRAHTTAGGNTRFLEPGDVVFVGEDGVPRPAPGKRSLFLSGEGERRDIGDDESLDRILGVDNDEEDFSRKINDALDDRFGGLESLSAGGVFFTEFYAPAVPRASGADVSVREQDGAWVVDYLRIPGDVQMEMPEFELFAREGETPSGGTGGHVLADGSTRIDWGVWDSSQYTATVNGMPMPEADRYDWHYMVANNTLDLATLEDMAGNQLTGSFQYDYVGGTLAADPNNTAATYTGGVSGSITVDFDAFAAGSTGSMYVDLTAFHNFTGYGSIEEFYNGGFDISGVAPGWIEGQFVGENAEGIVSNIQLDEQTEGTYWGTAAFEKGVEAPIPR